MAVGLGERPAGGVGRIAGAADHGGRRLVGRRTEREALDGLIARARAGTSGSIVLRGEAGVGKSALLDYLIAHAAGCRIARAIGVESEMELAFAGLHQLCAPFLARLGHLPVPQREALTTAFGITNGPPPDRFLVGLAVLTLLSEVAEEQPLICLLDDAQWLDRASVQVLTFVARRLEAEGVVLVFALRDVTGEGEVVGLPHVTLGPLSDADARALLATAMPGRLDESVRDRIVAEARGNPLALLELPQAWTVAGYAGGFGMPDRGSVRGRIEEAFRRRLPSLPEETRLLLLVAAADPTGDPALVWTAAERSGVSGSAAAPAIDAGLLDDGGDLRFRHPLVRSAVYAAGAPTDRQRAHAALADATNPDVDPDRRAWHRAHAAAGPDEDVAADLERSAGRAQARGGLAAAGAFLVRALSLTRDPARRPARALAAAQANLHAGAFDAALRALAAVDPATMTEAERARADLVRGQIAFATNVGREAPPLLLKAARQLEAIDPGLARETYLDAWGAALFAGGLATSGTLLEVSRAALSALSAPRSSASASGSDLLLEGLALLVTEGREAAAPTLRRATASFVAPDGATDTNFRWGWLTTVPSNVLWDDESWHAINRRQVQEARRDGALARLPIDLTASAILEMWWGGFAAAGESIAEAEIVTEATGTAIAPYAAMLLAALSGKVETAEALIAAAIKGATAGGQGIGVQYAKWARSILLNSVGRYEEAHVAAEEASAESRELFLAAWALPELIEAATRSGHLDDAIAALQRLTEATVHAGTDWALGVLARSRALVSAGEAADAAYREAIDRLGRTRLRPELARAHLLYGEWLRRENRRTDARRQLHAAHELFETMGAAAFAERARRELMATGETVRRRTVETVDQLSPQEIQIARLATDGRTNAEIAAELFLSARTVEWHLRKVFAKLGVSSRKELRSALPPPRSATVRPHAAPGALASTAGTNVTPERHPAAARARERFAAATSVGYGRDRM